MIDLTKIQYRVVAMDESKNQYNIKEYGFKRSFCRDVHR